MNEEQVKVKRPVGLTIISVAWTFGALYNLFVASVAISDALEVFPYLSMLPEWFVFAIPVEGILNIVAFAIGLLQMFSVYGLWNGKSWSYRLALVTMISMLIVSSLGTVLYATYPHELVEEWGPMNPLENIGHVVGHVFWLFVYVGYLRKPHVKEYLGQVSKE